MPYAQVHYPFENADWFESHFPADFIVEYIGQTRGWFYMMHVLATALFDRPAFKTCVSHGIVLGNDGQKMSKSLRNYPDVTEVFDRDGSDAMRWFLMASPILRGGNLIVTEQGIREGVRQVQLPIWNAYTFLALYAPKKGTWRTDSTHVLDRYILAKLAQLRDDLTASMDVCDISGACDELRQFTEALTNWYVRRSRSRFWEEDPDAIDTLHTVLEVAGRLAAPLLPLTTEVIWRGITGERSVHLTDWPESTDLPHDADLVATMDQVREVASAASSLRIAKRRRRRGHLAHLIHGGDQVGVVRQISRFRPVGEMDRPLAGDAAPDHLGDQRKQRRGQPAVTSSTVCSVSMASGSSSQNRERDRRTYQIRQRLGELPQLVTSAGDVADVHERGQVVAQLCELGQDVAIQHVGRVRAPGALLRRVQRQERVGVPDRQLHLPNALPDALFGDDQVAAPQNRRRHQEPAHGVGAVAVEDLGDIGIVAQRLAHLLAVVAQHDAVRRHGSERRAVEQRGGQHVHHVEPAAGLPDVLHDVVRRVVRLSNQSTFSNG